MVVIVGYGSILLGWMYMLCCKSIDVGMEWWTSEEVWFMVDEVRYMYPIPTSGGDGREGGKKKGKHKVINLDSSYPAIAPKEIDHSSCDFTQDINPDSVH